MRLSRQERRAVAKAAGTPFIPLAGSPPNARNQRYVFGEDAEAEAKLIAEQLRPPLTRPGMSKEASSHTISQAFGHLFRRIAGRF